MNERGEGTPKNISEAVRYARLAAAKDEAAAVCNLGVYYYHGNGVEKDLERAFNYFIRSMTIGGHAAAYTWLGVCYENAEGVAKDMSKAVVYYTKACTAGDSYGALNLGKCYMYGKGVARNFLTAEKYLTLAKERGNPHAQSYIDKLP